MADGVEESLYERFKRERGPRGNGAHANGANGAENVFDLTKADTATWHLEQIGPPEFVWGTLAARGEVTEFVSHGGGGKTTVQQQLLSSMTSGGDSFLGLTITAGAGYMLAAEDNARSARWRQRKIDRRLFGEVGPDQAPRRAYRLYVHALAGVDVFLWDEDGETSLMKMFEEMLAGIEGLAVAVLDNASALYGGNENSRPEVTRFLRRLTGIAIRLNIAIILLCHTSKSSDNSALRAASGSTAWINAARSVVRLTPQDEGKPATLQLIKSNLAEAPGPEIELVWVDGLLERPTDPDWFTKRAGARDLDEIILALVRAGVAPGRPYLAHSNGGKSRNIHNAVLAAHGRRFKRDAVEAAVLALLRTNRIVEVTREAATRTRPPGLYVGEPQPEASQ